MKEAGRTHNESVTPPAGSGSAGAEAAPDATDSLRRISVAVDRARRDPPAGAGSGDDRAAAGALGATQTADGSAQFLTALAMLRELRAQIAAWEPDLIDAARSRGASWAQLAPALGVASRQAAERRYLRLRPSGDQEASTGDQRVQAERDRRAGRRAVAHWARDHAADLRQLAGQISALDDLPSAADGQLADLRRALGGDDAADLLGPLAGTRHHLEPGHPALAARLRDIAARTDSVHRLTRDRRQPRSSED